METWQAYTRSRTSATYSKSESGERARIRYRVHALNYKNEMKGVVASMVLSATTGEKATREDSLSVAFSINLPFGKNKKVPGFWGSCKCCRCCSLPIVTITTCALYALCTAGFTSKVSDLGKYVALLCDLGFEFVRGAGPKHGLRNMNKLQQTLTNCCLFFARPPIASFLVRQPRLRQRSSHLLSACELSPSLPAPRVHAASSLPV